MFISGSSIEITALLDDKYASSLNEASPTFHLIRLDETTVASSVYSKDTVTPSDSVAPKNPSVGPAAPSANVCVGPSVVSPSPSASCAKPINVISPVNIPVSGPFSTSLYAVSLLSLV